MSNVFEKRFERDEVRDTVLVLKIDAVSEEYVEGGYHSREHSSGWKISGEVHEDYMVWVNEFEAVHPVYGRVWGDFEDVVYADSEEGFAHFWKNHEPFPFCYADV